MPSTGEFCPYVHIFFRLRDGSHIAFFDLGDGQTALPSPNTPDWVNHIAWRVDSPDDLAQMKQRLQAHGIEVIGISDPAGSIHSIYFFDPNGLRLELTVEMADAETVRGHADAAHALLRAWNGEVARRAAAGETT